ncbi:MAG: ABC transporter substrate-binding protein [Desulfobacteraceae bacterium]|nr:ABC transporter substrate-binding protein [Desulfobacteraceae bacterium]
MKKAIRFFLLLTGYAIYTALTPGAIYADPVKVGVLLPITGKLDSFGEIELRSFAMAVDEINAAGGINGNEIDLIIGDTAGKAETGLSAIEKLLLQDKVLIVAGGCSSSVAWAVAAVAQEHKVPFLINTASADKITEQGWEYIFRLNPPVSEYPKALVSFLTQVARPKSATVLYEKTAFGQYGLKKFLELRKRSGLKVVSKQSYEPGEVDFRPVLVKTLAKKPDLVYMISSSIVDPPALLHQAKELGLNPKIFVGFGASFTLQEFCEYAGDTSEYVMSVVPWTPSLPYPGANEYYENFVAKYNSPADYHGAQAYAAMNVIADALNRAESLTPSDVRDALEQTDTITAFGPVKFISYGKKTQQNSLATPLVQWIKGRIEIVWPKELATARYVYPVPKWSKRQ